MITYICSIITNDKIQEYIGIVLMVAEALLVIIRFLQYIVDPDSKFGKFLSRLLKGIKFIKDEANTASEKINEVQDNGQGKDATDGQHGKDSGT